MALAERGVISATRGNHGQSIGFAACRVPDRESLEIVLKEADDVIAVTDEEVAAAMRLLFKATHNLAEGAGAASLAGAMQQRHRWQGKSVGTTLCGGNVDTDVFAKVLAGT
jgi:threonine dehydratase